MEFNTHCSNCLLIIKVDVDRSTPFYLKKYYCSHCEENKDCRRNATKRLERILDILPHTDIQNLPTVLCLMYKVLKGKEKCKK